MPERISLESALDVTAHHESELIDCSVASEPDPEWRRTDASGHEHYYAKGRDRYPTLLAIRRHGVFEDGDTYTYIHHYKCRRCREWIYPGQRQPGHTYMRGLAWWSAEVRLKRSDELAGALIDALYANVTVNVAFPGGIEREVYVTDVSFDDRMMMVKLRA